MEISWHPRAISASQGITNAQVYIYKCGEHYDGIGFTNCLNDVRLYDNDDVDRHSGEKDVFTTLLEEVSSLPQNVDKIICGDFNSRTSNLPDFFANVYHQGSDGVLWPQLETNAEILSDKVF